MVSLRDTMKWEVKIQLFIYKWEKNGHYKAFDQNGNLTEERLYKNDRFIEQIYGE